MPTLRSLSDKELLAETLKLRHREHKTTLEILAHLNEIERRRLHLKLGYSSLFDYCTRHLKYSASAAGRRIQTARCVRSHPEVYELLEQDKVSLTTVSYVAPILNESNKREILGAICSKTQREVEAIASRYRPPVELRDRVKPVCVHVPDDSRSGSEISMSYGCGGKEAPGRPPVSTHQNNSQMSDHSRSGSGSASEPTARIQQKLLIQFLADEAFMKKYEEVRSLISQRFPDTSFASVFEALINEFLERHSPSRRKARRDMRKNAHRPAPAKPCQAAAKLTFSNPRHAAEPHHTVQGPRTTSSSNPRHIPAAVRDEVFLRDKARCTYVGKTGTRCESTQALQIDHIVPFARGGPTTASNLRLLCAKHNRLAAEDVFGEASMRRFRTRDPVQPQRE